MKRAAGVVAALAAILAASGCSDDAPAPDEPAGDPAAIRAGLAALYAGDHPGEAEQAAGECFAGELTATASHDALRAAGVLDASYAVVDELPVLPRAVAEQWADAQFACTDFVEESTRAQLKVTKGRLDPDEYAGCLRAALTSAQLHQAVVESLSGAWGGEGVSRLGSAQAECSRAALPPDPR